MALKDLYEEYGKLSIQLEIVQNRLMEIKRKIVEELKKEKDG